MQSYIFISINASFKRLFYRRNKKSEPCKMIRFSTVHFINSEDSSRVISHPSLIHQGCFWYTNLSEPPPSQRDLVFAAYQLRLPD